MKIKKNYLIAATAFLVGCGMQEPDYSKMSLEELKQTKAYFKTSIDQIDKLIEEKDTTKVVVAAPVPVVWEDVKLQNYESFVEVHGVVESGENVMVMPEFSGVITKIRVQEGQKVNRGQVIATLDAAVLVNNKRELQKRLELATEIYEKQKNLRAQNVGSEIQFLEAKNNKESLEQSIKTVNSQIGKAVINSPISGKVDKIFPKTGEMAGPGMPIARVVNTRSGYYIEGDVSEAYFRKIKQADSLIVEFPSLGEKYKSVVSYRGNYINPGNRTFKIRASLSHVKADLAPNLLGVIKLRDAYEKNVVVVEQKAINSTNTNGHYVYVVGKSAGEESFKVERRTVSIQHMYNNLAWVTGELKPGDKIITKAQWYKLTSPETKVIYNK